MKVCHLLSGVLRKDLPGVTLQVTAVVFNSFVALVMVSFVQLSSAVSALPNQVNSYQRSRVPFSKASFHEYIPIESSDLAVACSNSLPRVHSHDSCSRGHITSSHSSLTPRTALSDDKPKVLHLNQPVSSLLLIWHQHKLLTEASHLSILPLIQPHIPADLDSNAHVLLHLPLPAGLCNLGIESRIDDLAVQTLYIVISPGHFRVLGLEGLRVVGDISVVVDDGEIARWSGACYGWDVVAGDVVAR